jgi:hypothetical protein
LAFCPAAVDHFAASQRQAEPSNLSSLIILTRVKARWYICRDYLYYTDADFLGTQLSEDLFKFEFVSADARGDEALDPDCPDNVRYSRREARWNIPAYIHVECGGVGRPTRGQGTCVRTAVESDTDRRLVRSNALQGKNKHTGAEVACILRRRFAHIVAFLRRL